VPNSCCTKGDSSDQLSIPSGIPILNSWSIPLDVEVKDVVLTRSKKQEMKEKEIGRQVDVNILLGVEKSFIVNGSQMQISSGMKVPMLRGLSGVDDVANPGKWGGSPTESEFSLQVKFKF